MTRTSAIWTRLAGLSAAATLLLAAVPSNARTVAIDFGDSFATSGELFTSFGQPGTGGTTSFDLNLGAGAQAYDFCFNANGFVSLAAAGGSGCTYSSTPTGDFLAPYAAPFSTAGTNTSWSAGLLGLGTAPFSVDNTTAAYRFIWEDSVSGAATELMLVNRDAGNFDIEFRYGNPFALDPAVSTGVPTGGLQGFTLGDTTLPLTGSSTGFSGSNLYLYSFVNGVCTTCGGTTPPVGEVSVPEPSTLFLMAAGLLGLVVYRSRRNRRGVTLRMVAAS
ncbi:MAG: PEP-CTERM sorting domain-containing protein [Gammaproteobacteria bacterium]